MSVRVFEYSGEKKLFHITWVKYKKNLFPSTVTKATYSIGRRLNKIRKEYTILTAIVAATEILGMIILVFESIVEILVYITILEGWWFQGIKILLMNNCFIKFQENS